MGWVIISSYAEVIVDIGTALEGAGEGCLHKRVEDDIDKYQDDHSNDFDSYWLRGGYGVHVRLIYLSRASEF